MRERRRFVVHDLMQSGYVYFLTEPAGRELPSRFPARADAQGDARAGRFRREVHDRLPDEFPRDWFAHAKLCHERHDPELNFFGVNASKPLSYWQEKGWIYQEDPRGWFQWYCRYYLGRRCPDDDRQIKRWKAMKRHIAQIERHCRRGRPRLPEKAAASRLALGLR